MDIDLQKLVEKANRLSRMNKLRLDFYESGIKATLEAYSDVVTELKSLGLEYSVKIEEKKTNPVVLYLTNDDTEVSVFWFGAHNTLKNTQGNLADISRLKIQINKNGGKMLKTLLFKPDLLNDNAEFEVGWLLEKGNNEVLSPISTAKSIFEYWYETTIKLLES
jgi:hypothetical protein